MYCLLISDCSIRVLGSCGFGFAIIHVAVNSIHLCMKNDSFQYTHGVVYYQLHGLYNALLLCVLMTFLESKIWELHMQLRWQCRRWILWWTLYDADTFSNCGYLIANIYCYNSNSFYSDYYKVLLLYRVHVQIEVSQQ